MLLIPFICVVMEFRAAIQLQFDFHWVIYNLGTVLVALSFLTFMAFTTHLYVAQEHYFIGKHEIELDLVLLSHICSMDQQRTLQELADHSMQKKFHLMSYVPICNLYCCSTCMKTNLLCRCLMVFQSIALQHRLQIDFLFQLKNPQYVLLPLQQK